MKTIVLVALLAAAGCSKKSSECDVSIAKGMDNFAAEVKTRAPNPQMQQSMMSMVGKLKGALVQRCNQDKWSPEALACFAAVVSRKDIQGCDSKLTEEQRSKLHADMMQAMTGSRMAGGMAGHPPMLTGSGGPGGPAAPAMGGTAAPAASGTAAPAASGTAAPAASGTAAPAASGSAAPGARSK
jgi:hypothetical protein